MWVLGKIDKVWYMAKWVWDEKLAEHWVESGYEVANHKPVKI